MARTDRVYAAGLKAALAQDIERMVADVARAVSEAGADDVIGHSEHEVREVLGRFRTRVFQQGVQMRMDAAEASFSPSAEPAGRGVSAASQGPAEPGGADGQRVGADRA